MSEKKKEIPKSKCCNAKLNIEESGVSQLSYDVDFFCSKCGKEDKDVRPTNYPNW